MTDPAVKGASNSPQKNAQSPKKGRGVFHFSPRKAASTAS